MKQNNSHHNSSTPDQDHRLAALGIHTSEVSTKTPCPDDLEFARLVENAKIDDPQYADFYCHLNACEECYHKWIIITSLERENFAEKLLRHFKNRRSLSFIGSAIAVAATVLIVFQMPSKDQLHKQLSEQPQPEVQRYEMPQQRSFSDKAASPEKETGLNVPAEVAAPAPMAELKSEADADAEIMPQKAKTDMTSNRIAKPADADGMPSILVLKAEIQQFCQQAPYDEDHKSRLVEIATALIANDQKNEELIEIHRLLEEMTATNRPELCEKLRPIIEK